MPASFLRSIIAAVWLSAVALIVIAGMARADPVVAGEEHCVVNVRTDDTLNMRTRPNARAEIVARKRHDECGILVHEPCRGNWCSVEDGHSLGWVHRRYIAMVSPAMYCVSGVAPGDVLNLRAYPSPRSRVLTRLPRHGCGIAFLPYAVGGWQKVRVEGWQGWVSRRHLSGE
jgi:SH3-like domain-containing protein